MLYETALHMPSRKLLRYKVLYRFYIVL
uniref:Uncharacterized protein n=1 Tax=Anguilla anguilla TaxID=7936 RepID=A0A0E9VRG6_ANGAN